MSRHSGYPAGKSDGLDPPPASVTKVKPTDLGIEHTRALRHMQEQLAYPPPGWFTFGTHADKPGVDLEFWGDDGGGLPIWERPANPGLADRTSMSIKVFWETKDWSASKFRAALVDARLRARS